MFYVVYLHVDCLIGTEWRIECANGQWYHNKFGGNQELYKSRNDYVENSGATVETIQR